MSFAKVFIGALLGGLAGVACVSQTAGYHEVKSLSSARLGAQTRWQAQDAKSGEVDSLLAQPLTVELAGKIAVLGSPRVQAEFEKLGIARAAWRSALSLPNPQVGGALVYGIDDSPEVDLDASLNVTSLLMLGSRSGVADTQLQATVYDVTNTVVAVAFDARRAFVDYSIAVAELDLRQNITHSWAASAEMAQRLFSLGNVPELHAANERAFYEEMRVSQARAEAKVKAARERLNAALGLWGKAGAEWKMAEPAVAALPPFEDLSQLTKGLESRAVAASLGLGAARLRYEAFAKQANLTRFAGFLPQVEAGVRVARQQDAGNVEWGAGPLVEVGVPLFYQGQGETDSALAEMRRQEATLDDLAIRTRSASRAAVAKLLTTAQMADHYRNVILPLRGRVVEQTQLQYNAMSIGVFELLQAKNMEISAHLTYLDLMRECWSLRLDVEELLAGGLSGGVVTSDAAEPMIAGPAAAHD